MATIWRRPKRRGPNSVRQLAFCGAGDGRLANARFHGIRFELARASDEIWRAVGEFLAQTQASGVFAERRATQQRAWLHDELRAQLQRRLCGNAEIRAALPEIEAAVINGELPAATAAERLPRLFAQ